VIHIQNEGMIHGDIKPLNIVRESGRIKLLDLDACVSYRNKDVCGAKFSSAYLPPEMIHCDLVNMHATVKSYQTDETTGTIVKDEKAGFELMAADTSMDAWAVGVTAFELCTGVRAFAHPWNV
jgi:serine/threonine protein kinase